MLVRSRLITVRRSGATAAMTRISNRGRVPRVMIFGGDVACSTMVSKVLARVFRLL